MNEFLQIYLPKIQLACLNLKLLQQITLQTWVEEWAVKWKKGEAEPGSKEAEPGSKMAEPGSKMEEPLVEK